VKLLTVDTIEQAREKIINHVKSWQLKTETACLNNAVNRILAEDLFAVCDIPSFRRSTVDGYAVIASETAGAGESAPFYFKLKGSVLMGKEAGFSVCSGECAYVPTGGMLPAGADAVVMAEYTEDAGEGIAVYEPAASGSGTAEQGEDFKKGNLLLRRGTCIRPQEIGALSAAGITSVNVFAPIAISIISTGDELAAPEQEPAPGQVRDINTNLLKALAVKHGYSVLSAQVFPDDELQLENAVREAMLTSAIVIISGGSSQGKKDLTADIINKTAKPGIFTHGLAVKPGKPAILGWDEAGKTLLAGLPGHPVSAMMIFELLFGWLNAKNKIQKDFPVPARVSCNVPGAPGKLTLLPVVLMPDEACSYYAEPVFGKAGMISTLTQADGYIIIEMNREGLKKGETVMVHLF